MNGGSMFDLSGRVALVTAGGHGLGREYCDAMAEFGADVACNDIDKARAQETVELIRRHGHQAIAIQGDVSKEDEIERMVNQTVLDLGTIDILFCNAGIVNPLVPLHELRVEDWDRVMALNLRGTFLCMRAVLPLMLKRKRGSIIITSSISGLSAGRESPRPSGAYGTSKAALLGLTRHAAVSYARAGIRVNAIVPGAHGTRGLSGLLQKNEEMEKWFSSSIPMGRIAKPGEIKGLAVYLASDASSYVTGQTFVEDGGLTA